MKIQGINHLTFSVVNLEASIAFYRDVLEGTLLVQGERMAYFDLQGIWLALNVQEDIPRTEITHSYTHIAFTVDEQDFPVYVQRLQKLGVTIREGRSRDKAEAQSVYFTDPDGHLFEFHTSNREQRIQHYKDEKKPMTFYI
ncbi:metallothiol transferase FosB [Aneurinibacillus migulanus]|uniref:metallothiol transferase FosB n=1 Tax=Aneurinibacillus migulanus TaxID=47500 RepID=UPI002E24A3B1|nr:metallothiol transferase FosB [Aneurinibacillus migulanus]